MEEPPQRSDLHGLHREFTRIRGPGGHTAVIDSRVEERKAPVREERKAPVREERK
jgi:hypothetical protein